MKPKRGFVSHPRPARPGGESRSRTYDQRALERHLTRLARLRADRSARLVVWWPEAVTVLEAHLAALAAYIDALMAWLREAPLAEDAQRPRFRWKNPAANDPLALRRGPYAYAIGTAPGRRGHCHAAEMPGMLAERYRAVLTARRQLRRLRLAAAQYRTAACRARAAHRLAGQATAAAGLPPKSVVGWASFAGTGPALDAVLGRLEAMLDERVREFNRTGRRRYGVLGAAWQLPRAREPAGPRAWARLRVRWFVVEAGPRYRRTQRLDRIRRQDADRAHQRRHWDRLRQIAREIEAIERQRHAIIGPLSEAVIVLDEALAAG